MREVNTPRNQLRIPNNGDISLTARCEKAVGWALLNPYLPIPPLIDPPLPRHWAETLDEEDAIISRSVPRKGSLSASIKFSALDIFKLCVGGYCVPSEYTGFGMDAAISDSILKDNAEIV